MIYLTEYETGTRIPVFIHEISAVTEGPASNEAGTPVSTRVFISGSDDIHGKCLIVKESPKEIGGLMIGDLMDAGEDIKEVVRDGELSEDYRPRV